MAADIVIDDAHRLDRFRRAETSRERLDAACMYLLKILKNGSLAAGARNDRELLELADHLQDELAERMLCAADELKKFLEAHGYRDFARTSTIRSAPADGKWQSAASCTDEVRPCDCAPRLAPPFSAPIGNLGPPDQECHWFMSRR